MREELEAPSAAAGCELLECQVAMSFGKAREQD